MSPYYKDDFVTLYHGDCMEMSGLLPKVDLVVTDPPYMIAYQTKLDLDTAVTRHRRIDGLEVANDNLPEEEADLFMDKALVLIRDVLKPGGVFYIFAPSGIHELRFRMAVKNSGMQLRQVIAWVKNCFVMGRQDYHWRHESILYGWNEGAAHYFVPDRTQDTVWECDRPSASPDHPTIKPMDIILRPIANSSRRNEIVFDPFCGSGTTLRAAKDLGRKAIGIEIEEKYCEVAAKRMQQECLDFGDTLQTTPHNQETLSIL